jgi:hypothetical protein
MSHDLSPLIQQFLNQKVEVTEHRRTFQLGGKPYTFTEVEYVESDRTITALKTAAGGEGLYLRVFTPGTMGTTDWRTDRLNAYVEKSPDGSHYRIDRLAIG